MDNENAALLVAKSAAQQGSSAFVQLLMNPNPTKDAWLVLAALALAVMYIWLFLLRPSGDGWGRGWNMIAFLIYSAPSALLAAAIAIWRSARSSALARRVATLTAIAGFAFPLICMFVIKAKA